MKYIITLSDEEVQNIRQVLSVDTVEDDTKLSKNQIEVDQNLYLNIVSKILNNKDSNIYLDENNNIIAETLESYSNEAVIIYNEIDEENKNNNDEQLYLANYYDQPSTRKITNISESRNKNYNKSIYIQLSKEIYDYIKSLDINLGTGFVECLPDINYIDSKDQLIINPILLEDRVEALKIGYRIELEILFQKITENLNKENLFILVTCNNYLISKGYYVTDKNQKEIKEKIINENDEIEKSLYYFNEYCSSYKEIDLYYNLFKILNEFKENLSNAEEESEVKEIYKEYKEKLENNSSEKENES